MPDQYLEIDLTVRDKDTEVTLHREVRSSDPQTPQQAIDTIAREIGHLWGEKHIREVEAGQ